MPTGYTAKLHDGKPQTFREFGLDCARAFGACLHMRDDDDRAGELRLREVGDYYPKRIKEIEAEIVRLGSLAPLSIELEHTSHLKTLADEAAKSRALSDTRRARYDSMLAEVKAWIPPTPDHVEIKKFMAEQIESSIKFDCDTGANYHDNRVKGTPRSAYLWHKERLAAEYQALENASKNLADEERRVAEANRWVLALIEALPAE